MKKLFVAFAFASLALAANAQENVEAVQDSNQVQVVAPGSVQYGDPVKKHSVETNLFKHNWFIQIGGEWNAWYSSQEHGLKLDRSPLKDFRGTPSAAIAIGKWFTPGIGLRTKFQGIWGRTVNDAQTHKNEYWVLNEHILMNFSNLLLGYNPERVWSFIPFAGGGVGRSMTHNYYAMDLCAGILNQFRLGERVSLNLELGWNRLETDIDGSVVSNGHRGWDSHDNNLYAELGLTFNLGKTRWEQTPDVDAIKALAQSQIDALNSQLNDANSENARLQKMLAEAQAKANEAQTVKELVATPISVFFNLDKSVIASKKDLVNVEAFAKYAQSINANVVVTGYADLATGSPEHNQGLSERRAETVANELVNMGISRDKITTVGKGGVDELSPISFNRRATVKIAE